MKAEERAKYLIKEMGLARAFRKAAEEFRNAEDREEWEWQRRVLNFIQVRYFSTKINYLP